MASILSEGIGYFVLLGVGLVMALVVTLLVKAETKWLLHGRAQRQDRADRVFGRFGMDVGGHPFAIFYCSVPVWH
jgi:hypothetical protein